MVKKLKKFTRKTPGSGTRDRLFTNWPTTAATMAAAATSRRTAKAMRMARA